MLWIALHLPDLSLQATTRGLLPQIPVAITETKGNRTLIQAANAAARDAGVNPGSTAAAALAVAGDIVLLPRDPAREHDALTRIALSSLQFTPGVSIVRDCVLLDIESSLILFDGLGQLCRALKETLRHLGYQATLGAAPVPLAAELFARAKAQGQEARACMDPAVLDGRLRPLPTDLLPWDEATRQTLAVLGLRTLAQLFDLPRDGVLRRFGFECARDLERMTGALPDPRTPIVAPERLHTTFDLAAEIDDLDLCLNAIGRLLAEAQGFLSARGAATTSIALTMHHGRQLTTRHEIGSSLPQRDREQWLLLIREQLQRSPLPAAVTAIDLAIDNVCEYVPPPNGWLPDPRAQTEDRLRLLDRLAARLGRDKICTIALVDEHRPEHASSVGGMGQSVVHPAGARAGALGNTRPAHARGAAQSNSHHENARGAAARSVVSPANKSSGAPAPLSPWHNKRPRPAWLLERPRALIMRDESPLHHGPLTLLAGPERIQSGWWDNHPVSRDYFVARNPLGETCWIYRDIRHQESGIRNQGTEKQKWFLHGVFG